METMTSPTRGTQFPLSRVRTIMKSSPDLESVRQEPLALVAHLTELFVADFAKRAFENGGSPPVLEYKHLANLVQKDDTLDFLLEIMPPKITVRQYKEIMAKKANEKDSDEETSDSDLDEINSPKKGQAETSVEEREPEESLEVQEGLDISEDVILIEDD